MSEKYFVKINCVLGNMVEIEIRDNPYPGAGYISAIAKMNIETQQIEYLIYPNVSFNLMSLEDAFGIVEWLELAIKAGKTLQEIVKTRDDLNKTYEAIIIQGSGACGIIVSHVMEKPEYPFRRDLR